MKQIFKFYKDDIWVDLSNIVEKQIIEEISYRIDNDIQTSIDMLFWVQSFS